MTINYLGQSAIGTAAERAAAIWTGLTVGYRYSETDTGLEYYWNGTAWSQAGGLMKAGYRYTVQRIGSNYYSMKNDGTILSSDTTGHPETVIQATIDACEADGGGEIYISGTGSTNVYQLSGTFTGFTIGNASAGTSPDVEHVNVVCALDAYFKVPNSFVAGVFCTFTNAVRGCGWYGGVLYQSTPSFDWVGFEFKSDTQAGNQFNTLERVQIRNADVAIKLNNPAGGTQGFVNGNYFHDIVAYSCNTGVLFAQGNTYVSGQNSMNRNLFHNFIAEHNNRATALYGIKDVIGRDNVFIHCKIWDILQTASYHTCTITANAEYTIILGGIMTQVGWPTDNLSNTTICNDMWSPTRTGKGQIYAQVAKTGNYTATLADDTITVDGTSSAFTITLPTAVGTVGREFTIRRTDILASTNLITVATTSSQTIDGATNNFLWPGQSVQYSSDGTNWITKDRTNNVQYFLRGSTADRRQIAGYTWPSTAVGLTSTTAPTIDTLWAIPFILTQTTKIDTITFRQTTAATAGGVARMGIYRDNGNMYPGVRLFDSGSIATDGANGGKDATITAGIQVFPPGLYWAAWECGVAAPQIMIFSATTGLISFGNDSGLSANNSGYGYSVAHTFGTLPDPYTAGASPLVAAPSATVPVPRLGLRIL